jgi:hypothetical protein
VSDLRALIGEQLSEVLDVIDEDADSVVVRIEVSAGRAGESAPPLCHEFTLRVVGGEWQASSHGEQWGLPSAYTRPP